MLPCIPMPISVLTIEDAVVEVRGLSRSEVVGLGKFVTDPDEAEVYVLSRGASVPECDARNWRDSTSSNAVGLVVDEILRLSGLTEGASKSDAEGAVT